PVRLPEYFPEGYTLVEHTYQPLSGSSGMLSSEYRNGDKFIYISQDHFGGGGFGYGAGFDKDSSRVLQVRVREAEGTLIERRKNGTASLVWFEGAALYQIGGYLTPEEVLAMAESMQLIH
ncbi:MAG: DUF4367 domain-containing protein, partial [Candidatus Desulforudis sp.]|nr:DUF4367 domain-containing protein [Desulforudis sp.]